MNNSILVISTQYPGYGGSATNSYAIIKFLRSKGYLTIGVFVDDNININVDPDQIGDIYLFKYRPFYHRNVKMINAYRKIIDSRMRRSPDFIFCKNYIAPFCSKMLYPEKKNVYFVSGLTNIIKQCHSFIDNKNSPFVLNDEITINDLKQSSEINKKSLTNLTNKAEISTDDIRYSSDGSDSNNLSEESDSNNLSGESDSNNLSEESIPINSDYIDSSKSNNIVPTSEKSFVESISPKMSSEDTCAINYSDVVVVNSPLSLELLYKSYPNYKHKIFPEPIDTSMYILPLFNDPSYLYVPDTKKYDFIITASILSRIEKNNLFLIDILSDPVFDSYTKLIVGNDNSNFRGIPNSTVYDLVPHNELMKLLSESKILLYPSLYDSNPNTIREALHYKCLILMSNNIGYHHNFPEISVCRSYNKKEWTDKSLFLIENFEEIIKDYNIDFSFEKDLEYLINNI